MFNQRFSVWSASGLDQLPANPPIPVILRDAGQGCFLQRVLTVVLVFPIWLLATTWVRSEQIEFIFPVSVFCVTNFEDFWNFFSLLTSFNLIKLWIFFLLFYSVERIGTWGHINSSHMTCLDFLILHLLICCTLSRFFSN